MSIQEESGTDTAEWQVEVGMSAPILVISDILS